VLTLTGPAIALLFTSAFLAIWCHWRKLGYLLWFAAAFLVFAVAALSQILRIPWDWGSNAVTTCILYTAAVLIFSDGLLRRLNLRANYLLNFTTALLIVGGISYFYYVHRNLSVRIYILNFGLGLLLLGTALKIGRVASKITDRVLFWTLLIFAIQFFPRTVLSIGYVGNRRDIASLTQSPFWIWLNFSFIIFTVILGLTILATVVSDIVGALQQKANTDALTGVLNRRGFEEFVKRQALKAEERLLSLVVFDIDNFKSINDSYGHDGGDAVLVKVASLVFENMRSSDAVARFGGEEFIVFLSDLDRGNVYAVAERLRSKIAHTRFGSGVLRRQTVTASFGVVEFRCGESLDEAIRRADELMYEAKRSGKNRIVVSWLCA
jgi:diguanylate cyclase (GGDEF)-like protein